MTLKSKYCKIEFTNNSMKVSKYEENGGLEW